MVDTESHLKMEIIMKVKFKVYYFMVLANIILLLMALIKANGKMEWHMDVEFPLMSMEICM